jgi:hypothetical protein
VDLSRHSAQGFEEKLWKVVVFNPDHSQADIWHPDESAFLQGGATSLTLFPSDQILVARLLAGRSGCYLHSAGPSSTARACSLSCHSEAGKSTTTQCSLTQGRAAICRSRSSATTATLCGG